MEQFKKDLIVEKINKIESNLSIINYSTNTGELKEIPTRTENIKVLLADILFTINS